MSVSTTTASATAVHPHGRGDNEVCDSPIIYGAGSPPRAWGQLMRTYHITKHRRFTPTGVGTIAHSRESSETWTVHPHGRGDNAVCER